MSGALLRGADWKLGAWIGGWRDGGGEPVEVRAPATDELLGTFAAATADVVATATAAGAAAQPAWQAAGAFVRERLLRNAAQLFDAHREEVVAQLVRESGSTRARRTTRSTRPPPSYTAVLFRQPQHRAGSCQASEPAKSASPNACPWVWWAS